MKRRPFVGFYAEVVAWVATCLGVFGVVAWHDVMINSYWHKEYDRNSLFLTQRQYRRSQEPSSEPEKPYATWLAIMRYEADLSAGLLAASAGMVLVNAARRLRVRRAWRGPGAVACVTAVAAMGLCILEETSLAVKGHRGLWGSPSNPFPNAWPNLELRIGLAVLGAWVILAGSRRWRLGRSWADWIGVGIGSSWLVVVLYRLFASLSIPFANWGY